MKQLHLKKVVIATSAFACTALLSVGWSGQGGVSLSVESAQARVGRPLTPVSVAGVARRQNRRAAYQYNAAGMAGPMAVDYAGIAAAGTGAAVGAATSPGWGWGGNPYAGGPYAGGAYDWGGQGPGPYTQLHGRAVGPAGPAMSSGQYLAGVGRPVDSWNNSWGTQAAYAGGPYAGGAYGWGGQGPGPYTQLHGRAVSPAGPAMSSGQYLAGVGRPVGSWNNSWGTQAAYVAPATTTAAPAWSLRTAYRANGPWYGYSGWDDYKARGGIACDPGTMVKGDGGVMHPCQ